MHLFSENKKRNDFGNSFFVFLWGGGGGGGGGGAGGGGGGGGGRERGKIADVMNIETASAIFYCRFAYYYNWSTSSIFKE